MTTDDRSWAAGRRLHGLLLRGSQVLTPEHVVAQLTVMQAQEHRYARWSVAQRCAPGTAAAATVDRAFDEGHILRTHVLRPTWHYVAPEDLRWLTRLSGPRLAAASTRRSLELGLDAKTLTRSADAIGRAIERGPRTRAELAGELARSGIATDGQRLPHILMHAEISAVATSGPMQGKQHSYAAFTETVSFKTPLNIAGYRHVLVRDGRLLGHWRVTGSGRHQRVETRPGTETDPTTDEAVAQSVEAYRRFIG